MKILFLAPWFPYPPDNGIRIRLYNLLRAIGKRHKITLLAFVREGERGSTGELTKICREIQTVPWRSFQPASGKAMLGFFSPTPRSHVETSSPEMMRRVAELDPRHPFDLVIASTLDTAEYALRAPARVRVLEEHNSMTRWMLDKYQQQPRMLARARAWLTFWKCRRYETRVYSRFDACTMVSELDAQAARKLLGYRAPLRVVPNSMDLDYYSSDGFAPQLNELVFNGSLSYAANLDAIRYFLSDAWQHIKKHAPNVRLKITGKVDGVDLKDVRLDPSVTLTGHLDDIRPTVARAWACVVPLRTGGGTRLKILEAMALGTPVIATTKGAEGLDVIHGENILIADDPAEFARCVLAVLNNAQLRACLATNARRLVETKHDWKIIGAQFESFLCDVVSQVVRPGAKVERC